MASQAPPPSSPAGVPSSGGAKYVVIAIILLGLIAGAVVWKLSQKPEPPPVLVLDAGPPPTIVSGRNLDDDIPLPPTIEDAGPEKKKVVVTQVSNACDAKRCTGTSGTELENALGFRAKQAHRCYDNALAQDPTLRGKLVPRK
jgi:hypothetical protein